MTCLHQIHGKNESLKSNMQFKIKNISNEQSLPPEKASRSKMENYLLWTIVTFIADYSCIRYQDLY